MTHKARRQSIGSIFPRGGRGEGNGGGVWLLHVRSPFSVAIPDPPRVHGEHLLLEVPLGGSTQSRTMNLNSLPQALLLPCASELEESKLIHYNLGKEPHAIKRSPVRGESIGLHEGTGISVRSRDAVWARVRTTGVWMDAFSVSDTNHSRRRLR